MMSKMKFSIEKPIEDVKIVTLIPDNEDVNICVDGNLVAYFDGSEMELKIYQGTLDKLGIKCKEFE